MKMVSGVRRLWPRFLKMRTMMIGCAAGEGHLDAEDAASRYAAAASLASGVMEQAQRLKTKMVVFKEFPAADRAALSCLKEAGFARLPSMPMTRVRLNFTSFEDYLSRALSRNTRSQLRRKFKETEQRAKLEMRVVSDITPYIDEIFPLYLGVYERSSLRFEKLTPDYFRQIAQRMPDKALFFLWLDEGKIAAFNYCTIHDGCICSEYLGFDYNIAFDLNLYYITFRDVMNWAIANKCERWYSTALNYEPKFRLRQELVPLDLYVRHTSPVVNFIMKRVLPYLEPTRYDKILQRFPNYSDLHAKQ
jgi:predicted N-acyltransferase